MPIPLPPASSQPTRVPRYPSQIPGLQLPNTSVYCLIDPRGFVVKYVGLSAKPIWRFHDHMKVALGNSNRVLHYRGCQWKVCDWIRELHAQYLEPVLMVLETVRQCEGAAAEIRWIHYMVDRGEPLLNIMHTKRLAGEAGGKARTDAKRTASRNNLVKARAARALYRRNPAQRPSP